MTYEKEHFIDRRIKRNWPGHRQTTHRKSRGVYRLPLIGFPDRTRHPSPSF